MTMENLILCEISEAKNLERNVIDAFTYELETAAALGKKVNVSLIAAMIAARIDEINKSINK